MIGNNGLRGDLGFGMTQRAPPVHPGGHRPHNHAAFGGLAGRERLWQLSALGQRLYSGLREGKARAGVHHHLDLIDHIGRIQRCNICSLTSIRIDMNNRTIVPRPIKRVQQAGIFSAGVCKKILCIGLVGSFPPQQHRGGAQGLGQILVATRHNKFNPFKGMRPRSD